MKGYAAHRVAMFESSRGVLTHGIDGKNDPRRVSDARINRRDIVRRIRFHAILIMKRILLRKIVSCDASVGL